MTLPSTGATVLPFAMFSLPCFELPSAVRLEMATRLFEGKLTLRDAVKMGYATPDNVDDWVDFWHEQEIPCELREFLGLSVEQYAVWVKDSKSLEHLLGEPSPALAPKIFGSDELVPMSYWGKDHWTTMAYVESVMTDMGGFQVGKDARMKSNRRNFRVMAQECPNPVRVTTRGNALALVMEPEHATKLNDGQRVPNHDDWSCLQDMAAEGLFTVSADEVAPKVVLSFSEKGNKVANAYREFRRGGGNSVDFRWPNVPSPATRAAAGAALQTSSTT